MERQHIHAPLDREVAYHAIWPELADDIHLFGATDFMVDRTSDAEGDALEYLLDQITGNALTAAEAISMAIDLMPLPSAAVQSEWQAKRDAILQAFIRMLPNRPQQPECDQAFYYYHDANQLMEAVTGQAAAGELLSDFEQDVLRELDAADDHGEDADDRV